MTFILRPYQRSSIDAITSYWAEGGGNALVEMATGTGKGIVLAALVRELVEQYPTLRVLMLVHVRELIEQNFNALIKFWPQAPVGINSAGLKRRDIDQQIIFASIQSVYKIAPKLGIRDLVLVDECHLIPHDGEGMYRTLLSGLEAPDGMRVAGLSATGYRLDSGRLDQGQGRLFDKTVYTYGIKQGINDGYLSPLISKGTLQKLDTSGVARRGGEFVQGALENAVDQEAITRAAVDEIIQYGTSRRSWLTFCVGVRHAHNVADEIRSRGISCETITGVTPSGERDRILREFKAGQIRCLTNVMVLTTGFDAPQVDMIAMLRPTLSPGLYVQMCGRGTRLADEKQNCLILDFAKNVLRHGPVDLVQGAPGGAKDKNAEDNARECPKCRTLVAKDAAECPECGYVWPAPEVKERKLHGTKADATAEIISSNDLLWVKVDSMRCNVHRKHGDPSAPPTMRVEYVSGAFNSYNEWVCLSHPLGSFPRAKAQTWWRQHSVESREPVPQSVEEGVARHWELFPPSEIRVMRDGRFWKIVQRRFETVAA